METTSIGNAAKALLTSATASPVKQESSKIRRALDDKMILSEAIEAATAIVGCYPNGGRDAGRSYLGAVAATLASYPRQVAQRCAGVRGVVQASRFLPTVADVVAWCEAETAPLYRQAEREERIEQQLRDRPPASPFPPAPADSFYEMVKKHGRPIGRFEQHDDRWNRW